jgi:cyclophilin family peptidyl-prolyl cis-trans isomerase
MRLEGGPKPLLKSRFIYLILEVIEVPNKKLLLSAWTMATLLAITGCGKNSSENQPAASINGENGGSSKAKSQLSAKTDFELKHPQVIIDTSLGSITVELDREKSPLTVANFLDYADAHSYDQTIFHQVYKNQGILAGGYTADGSEIRPRIPVSNEAHNGLKNLRGTLAMYRQPDVIDSATSQFFINVADNPNLDYRNRNSADPEGYGYCVFGKVVQGMEVVAKIAETPVQNTDKFDQTPTQAIIVKSIRRVK